MKGGEVWEADLDSSLSSSQHELGKGEGALPTLRVDLEGMLNEITCVGRTALPTSINAWVFPSLPCTDTNYL